MSKERTTKKHNSLAKNTILLSIGSLLTKGLSFVLVPFFSRWLTTSDYGTFDLLGTYISLLIPCITLATGEAIFRFSIDKDQDELESCVTNGFLILAFNFILACIVLAISNSYLHSQLVLPFILLLFGELANNHLQAYLRAARKLDIYSFGSALTMIGFAIFVTLFVRILDLGLPGMVYGYAAGYLFGDIVLFVWSKYYLNFEWKRFSFQKCKDMIRYSCVLIPNSLSWWVINVSDRLVIKFALGPVGNGIYAIAYKIPNLCSSIFGMFSISWQEQAATIQDDNEKQTYFNHVYNKIIVTLCSLCAGILSCNFIFFNYIFDAKYREGFLYAPILVLAILFMTLSQFFGGIQIALKQPKENGISTIVGAIINFVVNVVLIRFIGLYAAALSTLVSNLSVSEIRRIRLRDRYVFKFDKRSYFYLIGLAYFFVNSYIIGNVIYNIVNLVLACIFFVLANRNMIVSIVDKVLKRR